MTSHKDFQNSRNTLLPTFSLFRPIGIVDEACLPRNAYYRRMPDYTLYSGVHACWSEHFDLSFAYGFMSLDYGLGTRTTTTYRIRPNYRTYPYKHTVKKFRSLQITTSVLFSLLLYKGICCGYSFELHRQVDAIQMSTHNICLCKESQKIRIVIIK